MSWEKTQTGNWRFVHNPDETYEESLKQCMSSQVYAADEGDWLALLVIATDIISAKLSPSGTPGPFGASFQAGYPMSVEAQSQDKQ